MLSFLTPFIPALAVVFFMVTADANLAYPNPHGNGNDNGVGDCEAVQDVTLQEFRWKYRLVVLGAPSASDARYQQQYELLKAQDAGLIERDLRILSLLENGCSTLDGHPISDESAARIRQQLEVEADLFSVRLIGKDGGVKVHERTVLPDGWLFAVIDGMPMRQREMREREQ